jgi:hypothetical protein
MLSVEMTTPGRAVPEGLAIPQRAVAEIRDHPSRKHVLPGVTITANTDKALLVPVVHNGHTP